MYTYHIHIHVCMYVSMSVCIIHYHTYSSGTPRTGNENWPGAVHRRDCGHRLSASDVPLAVLVPF